ncbi:MAG: 1-phosphofructokinase [Lachnospiraceae bacterium]|nr:1-phosphofructokinase [Lachnospiraceae bacterium]
MIYTVTLNPSIDYIADVENFEVGEVNRTCKEIMYPGGKGINVSIVLKHLGFENTALGFTAGFTGNEIKRMLETEGINTDFIEVKDGISRINLKLRSNGETEINGMGPRVSKENIEELFSKIDKLKEGDVLVLAGSIPSTMPETMYSDIMKRLMDKKVLIAVDATKDLLMNTLSYHPFVIKPNHKELGEIFGVKLETAEEILPYAKKLQEKGARNVIVSMGKNGAMMVDENGDWRYNGTFDKPVVNTVGAGDSFVAGFTAGYLATKDYEKAFYTGLCSGSASSYSEELAKKEEVKELLDILGRDYEF